MFAHLRHLYPPHHQNAAKDILKFSFPS
jgi:hypothetical protein